MCSTRGAPALAGALAADVCCGSWQPAPKPAPRRTHTPLLPTIQRCYVRHPMRSMLGRDPCGARAAASSVLDRLWWLRTTQWPLSAVRCSCAPNRTPRTVRIAVGVRRLHEASIARLVPAARWRGLLAALPEELNAVPGRAGRPSVCVDEGAVWLFLLWGWPLLPSLGIDFKVVGG